MILGLSLVFFFFFFTYCKNLSGFLTLSVSCQYCVVWSSPSVALVEVLGFLQLWWSWTTFRVLSAGFCSYLMQLTQQSSSLLALGHAVIRHFLTNPLDSSCCIGECQCLWHAPAVQFGRSGKDIITCLDDNYLCGILYSSHVIFLPTAFFRAHWLFGLLTKNCVVTAPVPAFSLVTFPIRAHVCHNLVWFTASTAFHFLPILMVFLAFWTLLCCSVNNKGLNRNKKN